MTPGRKRIMSVVGLVIASTLWLWPLMYLDGVCGGADIGIGLFGLPATFLGVALCLASLTAPRDRVSVGLGVVGAVLGVLAIGGLTAAWPPYEPWLQYAYDNWWCGAS